jgi:hypothetical protein
MSKYDHGFDDVGLHAFVFIDHLDPGMRISKVITDLFRLESEVGRVLWAAPFVGDYLGFAHIQVDDVDGRNNLAGLQTFIENDLWNDGVHCSYSTEITRPLKVGIKRDTPEIIALVGIKTEHGRAFEVADVLDHASGAKGCSVVLGHLDVVLQLGGDSLEEVVEHIQAMQGMEGLDGIVSTSTAITDGGRGPFT